jgi:hypothetical protein
MSRESILRQLDRLNVWNSGGQRAPYQPLLTLYALGRWTSGEQNDIPFREVDRDLTALFKEFRPPRWSYHAEWFMRPLTRRPRRSSPASGSPQAGHPAPVTARYSLPRRRSISQQPRTWTAQR